MAITAILTPDEATRQAAVAATAANTSTVSNDSTDFSTYLDASTSNNTLSSIFQKASDTYGVPMSLLTAMAKQESNFQADATSRSGAMGIMQLMPSTAASLGVTNAYDPEQNIMGGAKYISGLLDKYNGNVSLALAAYNAGSNNVDKYGGIPPFNETQNYVSKITAYMNEGVTLPDGNIVSGTDNTDNDQLKDILGKLFSYDDYQKLLSLFAENLKNNITDATSEDAAVEEDKNTAPSSTPVNSKFSVTVKSSNPNQNSDLQYASQNINYNKNVLDLMSQGSSEQI